MSYFLLDNSNPHAVGGFHGYASRRSEVRLLAIHTTESAFDTDGPDTGAENVSAYLSRTKRQASYHDISDSDSDVPCLPWDYTAFGARGFNSHVIHMAFAGQASNWHTLSDAQVTARLTRLANRARAACAEYNIPIVRIVGESARTSTARGICGHADLDPDRRYDPGSGFPWSQFINLLKEDDMPDEATFKQWVTEAVHDARFGRGDNIETFGTRVARIKVDARGADAKAAAALSILNDLTALVKEIAAKVDVDDTEAQRIADKIEAASGGGLTDADRSALLDDLAARLES